MKPEDIGLATDGIVLGKHSGRHALVARAKGLGFAPESETLDRAFATFKEAADEVGIVDTARLMAIPTGSGRGARRSFRSLRKTDLRSPLSTKPSRWGGWRTAKASGGGGM